MFHVNSRARFFLVVFVDLFSHSSYYLKDVLSLG